MMMTMMMIMILKVKIMMVTHSKHNGLCYCWYFQRWVWDWWWWCCYSGWQSWWFRIFNFSWSQWISFLFEMQHSAIQCLAEEGEQHAFCTFCLPNSHKLDNMHWIIVKKTDGNCRKWRGSRPLSRLRTDASETNGSWTWWELDSENDRTFFW